MFSLRVLAGGLLAGLIAGSALTAPAAVAAPRERTLTYLLRALPVAQEQPAGYDRDLFRLWVVQDSRGCDTRDIVLIDEAVSGPALGRRCAIGTGSWFSEYDGIRVSDASTLDIDHVVALAEAWASGARAWSPDRREAFANDLGYVGSLIAVSASVNRSKGDQDPAEWLPPRTAYRCTYVAHWIAVKFRWRLSIDSTESAALRVLVRGCGNPKIAVPRRA